MLLHLRQPSDAVAAMPYLSEVEPYLAVHAAGFGFTNEAGTLLPTQLMEVDTEVAEDFWCPDNEFNPEKEICVGQGTGANASHGDSGGPLISKTADQSLLVGITSREGNFDFQPQYSYNIFTKVSAYLDWILSETQGQTLQQPLGRHSATLDPTQPR